jgi:hypothetical protein
MHVGNRPRGERVEILPAADRRPAVSPGSWSAPIGNPAA